MTFGTLGLRAKLKVLGVWRNKHIPQAYLTASVAQRMALLQGLMDTDGTVSKAHKCTFTSSVESLAQSVAELIRSLGVKAHVIWSPEKKCFGGSYVSKPYYRVNFKMAGAASLPRKAERTRTIAGNVARTITVRETDRYGYVQCLQVANEDGLFLAGRGYVVTHNSKSEMTSWLLPTWFLGHNPKAKIMQCMNTQDLASGFGRRVRNVISREAIATEKKGLDPYHDVFPELDLAKDSGAAYHWHTTFGGEYYAVGVGGKIAGRGADLLVIDDPHALYTSTLLPTPEGFVAIGDIEVGDRVFGPDGKPTKVVAVSEVWDDRPLYEVRATDGFSVLCDAAHLWAVRNGDGAIVKTARDLDGLTFELPPTARHPIRRASCTMTNQRGPVRCITVEREDGLFLAGEGYIVTHNSEQEAKLAISNPEVFDQVYEWYVYGPRQRLQPNGKIILVQTRWSKRDLTGRLLQKMAEDDSAVADKWEQIEFPAILDEGTPNERALWPAYWPLETQQATRAALPVSAWQSQYQQNPVSGQSAIFKREYWRIWGEDKTEDVEAGRATCPGPKHAAAWQNLEPPACEYILHSWDTAIKKNQRADFSAFTSWGVFKAEDPVTGLEINHIILLSAWKARLEFPELKRKVREFYDEDRPDTLLIEDKGSGSSLIQELRSMGITVENFSYGRGQRGVSNDKIARANTISDVFASRYVWRPARRWAEEVETELSDFPGGAHDDYVDSTVQAMIRFRAGNLVATANDVEEEDEPRRFRRMRYY